jgi:hypothetical protein
LEAKEIISCEKASDKETDLMIERWCSGNIMVSLI